jgi:hypothetical protein
MRRAAKGESLEEFVLGYRRSGVWGFRGRVSGHSTSEIAKR